MNRFLSKYTPADLTELSLNPKINEQIQTILRERKNTIFVGDVGSGKTTLLKCLLNRVFGSLSQTEYVYWINTLDSAGVAKFRENLQTFCQTFAVGVLSSVITYPKVVIIDNIDTLSDGLQYIIHSAMTRYAKQCWFLITSSSEQSVIDRIKYDCKTIQLDNITEEYMRELCSRVIREERIDIVPSAVDVLIRCSNQSVRLMLMYLHKFILLNEPITESILDELCSRANDYEFRKFTIAWAIEKDVGNAYEIVKQLCERGLALCDLFEKYLDYIKYCGFIDEKLKYEVIDILSRYITIIVSHHEDAVEMGYFTLDLYCLIK
jgi:DNA polymerase III delta prime subunit